MSLANYSDDQATFSPGQMTVAQRIGVTHRDCRKCGAVKPFAEFTEQVSCKYGRRPYCKACEGARRRTPEFKEWRKQNREQPEQRAKDANYRKSLARKETLRRHAQSESFKRTQKKYRIRNPQEARLRVNIRRRKLRQRTPEWANQKYIKVFYRIAQLETERTGRQVDVDHIYPLNGVDVCGLHCEHNLQLMFKSDNARKGNRVQP